MKWYRENLIINPTYFTKKSQYTHAQFPTIYKDSKLIDDCIYIYFNIRDNKNESHVVRSTFSFEKLKIVDLNFKKILSPGKLGAFDDSGVTLGSICSVNEQIKLYYTGWNLTRKVIVNNSIGIASLNSKTGLFERNFDGPILTRSTLEPYTCASPFVLWDSKLSKYIMWYCSMDYWQKRNGSAKHYYDIKVAFSENGIEWSRPKISAVTYIKNSEYAFGRPFVRKINDEYEMFFSVRGTRYKIEKAKSLDGINWERTGPITWGGVSQQWENRAATYPSIYNYSGQDFMFYNGDGYGKTGIGMAILK